MARQLSIIHRFSLLGAIAAASIGSSVIVFFIGFLAPMRWLWQYRLEQVRLVLDENPGMSVLAAANQMGYSSLGHLTSAFKRHYGVTPGVYRSTVASCAGSWMVKSVPAPGELSIRTRPSQATARL
jgi:AraC-like DNA-binding protein